MKSLLLYAMVAGVWLVIVAGAGAQNLLTNPGLDFPLINPGGENAAPPGWQMDESIAATEQNDFESLAASAFFAHRRYIAAGCNEIGRCWNMHFKPYVGTISNQPDNYAHLFQTVPGIQRGRYTMTGFAAFEMFYPGGVTNLNQDTGTTPNGAPFNDGILSPTDTFFALEFLDPNDNVLPGSVEIELKAHGQLPQTTGTWTSANWTQHTLFAIAPFGTTQVRVRASMIDGVANPSLPAPDVFNMSAFVDAFSLTVAVPEPSSVAMSLAGLALLGASRQSRKAASRSQRC